MNFLSRGLSFARARFCLLFARTSKKKKGGHSSFDDSRFSKNVPVFAPNLKVIDAWDQVQNNLLRGTANKQNEIFVLTKVDPRTMPQPNKIYRLCEAICKRGFS